METIWFCIIAVMVAMYVILDGFDLGTGVLHPFVAKNDGERRVLMQSIGPVWDGNEVFLLAGGGLIVLAFPLLYATSFSGFYLPLMMVLWLLIARAIALELRSHFDGTVWKKLCDVGFFLASTLLCIFYGAALGNVVRGVPLDVDQRFFSALWADSSRPGRETGILDVYTVLIGVTALVALTQHGAHWLRMRTTGSIHARVTAVATRIWYAAAVLTVAVTAYSLSIQPQIWKNLTSMPWGWIFPLLAIAGLAGMQVFLRSGAEVKGFLASAVFLVGLLTSAAFGLYPNVLPSVGPGESLTVFNAAADSYAMRVAFYWWIPGMIFATVYLSFIYRKMGGKIVAPSTSGY